MENELMVVQWTGIKRHWDDGEEVGLQFEARDVQRAVELYLDAESQRFEAKDLRPSAAAAGLYTNQVGDLVYSCRQGTMPVPELELPRSIMPSGRTAGAPPITGIVYYGRAVNSSGYTEAQVLAWATSERTSRFGDYPYEEGPDTYVCIAIPWRFGAPSDVGSHHGFKVEDFFAAMGRPDGVPPYGVLEEGYGVERIYVGPELYRVYRSYYTLGGAIALTVL
jgi:hypothetical protein